MYYKLDIIDSCGPDDLAPLEFTQKKKVTWSSVCACRYTSSPPYCDGIHYQPHVGQDEWAEEHGLELPIACRPKKEIVVEEDEVEKVSVCCKNKSQFIEKDEIITEDIKLKGDSDPATE